MPLDYQKSAKSMYTLPQRLDNFLKMTIIEDSRFCADSCAATEKADSPELLKERIAGKVDLL
jgi:hypothetical protein